MVYDRCFSYFYCTAGVTGSDNAGIYGGHYRTGTDTGQWTLITGIAVAVLLVVVAICLALVIPKFKRVQTLTDDQSQFFMHRGSGGRSSCEMCFKQIARESSVIACRYRSSVLLCLIDYIL